MDIYEPIRELLLHLCKEEKPEENQDCICGIKSSYYPPTQLYPDGYKIEYPFAITPKDAERYNRH